MNIESIKETHEEFSNIDGMDTDTSCTFGCESCENNVCHACIDGMLLNNEQCIFEYGMGLEPNNQLYTIRIESNEDILIPNNLIMDNDICHPISNPNPYIIYDFQRPIILMMLNLKLCDNTHTNLLTYSVSYYTNEWIFYGTFNYNSSNNNTIRQIFSIENIRKLKVTIFL